MSIEPILDFLSWYVKDVEGGDAGHHFLVVHTADSHKRLRVTRQPYPDGPDKWICTCGAEAPTSPLALGCVHIRRAYRYYRDMLDRAKEMKRRAKDMAAEAKANPATPLLEAKRRIKLED